MTGFDKKNDTNIKFVESPIPTTEGTLPPVSTVSTVSTKSKAEIDRIIHVWKKQETQKDINKKTEAEKVILDKIAHYDKTGNKFKADFYRAKLADVQNTIKILKSVVT